MHQVTESNQSKERILDRWTRILNKSLFEQKEKSEEKILINMQILRMKPTWITDSSFQKTKK